MILVCPQCETSFALPDEIYKPGRKARCSQCANVFPMPDVAAPEAPAAAPKPAAASVPPPQPKAEGGKVKSATAARPGKLKLLLLGIGILLCLLGLIFGGYMVYAKLFGTPAETVETGKDARPEETPEQKAAREAQEARDLSKSLPVSDVTQFVIDNENLGRLVVIQGKVINNFTTPKELIWVEARLYDREGKVLASAKQICGIALSVTQLRVLNAREMTQALENKIEVLTNNINIQPGGTTPFMVVFQEMPEGMYEYEVRVIAANDPPKLAQESELPPKGKGKPFQK